MAQKLILDEPGLALLGGQIAAKLRPGDVVALRGGLGAGKTTLARAMIQSQLGPVDVPSPTYTLIQTYDMPEFELWHCDLYRLDHSDDVLELGVLDAFEEAVCVIEWPDKLGRYMPDNVLGIDIEFSGDRREVTLTGWGERCE